MMRRNLKVILALCLLLAMLFCTGCAEKEAPVEEVSE